MHPDSATKAICEPFVVAKGTNKTNETCNATKHSEFLAIESYLAQCWKDQDIDLQLAIKAIKVISLYCIKA